MALNFILCIAAAIGGSVGGALGGFVFLAICIAGCVILAIIGVKASRRNHRARLGSPRSHSVVATSHQSTAATTDFRYSTKSQVPPAPFPGKSELQTAPPPSYNDAHQFPTFTPGDPIYEVPGPLHPAPSHPPSECFENPAYLTHAENAL